VQLICISVQPIPVMELLDAFVHGFECILIRLNAGKRVMVFGMRENTRGTRNIRAARESTHGARKNARFARTAVFRHKTLPWPAPLERSYFRVRSYHRS